MIECEEPVYLTGDTPQEVINNLLVVHRDNMKLYSACRSDNQALIEAVRERNTKILEFMKEQNQR